MIKEKNMKIKFHIRLDVYLAYYTDNKILGNNNGSFNNRDRCSNRDIIRYCEAGVRRRILTKRCWND